jgi:ABC-type multidrug transport system fused ATPase/permease subunit
MRREGERRSRRRSQASGSQIHRFLILHKELDADDGELTRTRKVGRRFIAEKYASILNALYSGTPRCAVEAQVRFEDGRVGTVRAELEIVPAKTFGSASGTVEGGGMKLNDAQAGLATAGRRIGEVVLAVENISLAFGGVKALTEVSFDVREHEVRAIIGPNGAGKSSMLNVLNGVYRPQAGRITFAGETVAAMEPHRSAAKGIARTFQSLALFKGMSVLENILAGRNLMMKSNIFLQALRVGPALAEEIEHRKRVEEIIDFLEIQHVRKTPSGGCPTACRSASTSGARSRPSRRSSFSTSPWPA